MSNQPHLHIDGARSNRRPGLRGMLLGASLIALIAGGGGFYGSAATAGAPVTAPAAAATAAPDFVGLVEAVKPAVVSVQVRMKAEAAARSGGEDPFNGQNPFKGTPFEKFFKDFGGPHMKRSPAPQGPGPQALGSGFFISEDGYIVTNNHVVDGADKVEVVTDAGKTLTAKVVGTDPRTDLALLKVEDGASFPHVRLAASRPRIGEWVLAMGNPFGLGGTVTAGIVSAEGRDIGSGPYDDFIQIDAPVNKGNSGGPTFNLAGEVVGVNTAIFSPSGGSVGIAFDIPADTVRTIVDQLQAKGKVERAWLGVQIQPVTPDIAESLGLGEAKGALIATADQAGPGAKAGLKAGDVIVGVDGKGIEDARALSRTIGSLPPGAKVDIEFLRDGKPETLHVALSELKDEKVAAAALEQNPVEGLGITVEPASKVEGAAGQGLVVTEIDPSGPAADAGLSVGDVVVAAGGRELASPDDLTAAIAEARSARKASILVLVQRGEEQHFVAMPLAAG